MVFCSRMHGQGTVQLWGPVQACGPLCALVSPSEEEGLERLSSPSDCDLEALRTV